MAHTSTPAQPHYVITDKCICCGRCALLCPAGCIEADFPFRIRQEDCQMCGNCLNVCQACAVTLIQDA